MQILTKNGGGDSATSQRPVAISLFWAIGNFARNKSTCPLRSERVAELEGLRRERQSKFLMLEGFIQGIETRALVPEEFDERLWVVAVEKVTVTTRGKLVFSFKDGTEIEG